MMDNLPDRQREVNKYLWEMYNRRHMSWKMKFLLAALGVAFLGFVLSFGYMARILSILILLAVVIGFGFGLGFGYGQEKGEAAERKRMLDEGYSLGYQEPPEADDNVKPLRTCRRCGHIIDDEEI